MSEALFYVSDLPETGELLIDGPEGHHAASVARLRVGERLLVGDGRGLLVRSVVTEVGRGTVSVALGERTFAPQSQPRIVVVQGIPKGERGELAVQAMTEVGVDRIVPWSSSRAIAKWTSDKPLQRWVSTAREAAKQSRRAWLPVIDTASSTREALSIVDDDGLVLVLHEEASTPLSAVQLPATGHIALVVGPEGGIDATELAAFEKAGARAVRMGSNVLRTSTAGVAAIAALQTRLGRW